MKTIHEYMTECADMRFEWGKFDCCTFAAGAIEIATGIDVMRDIRTYKDESTCAMMLNDNFGTVVVREVFEMLVKPIGGRPIDLSEAKDGDIVCIQWPVATYGKGRVDQRCGLGVFYRHKAFACMHPVGIVKLPVTHRIIDVWGFR